MVTKMSAQQRHIPQRSCVACREKTDKRLLTRVVNTAEGIRLDPRGKLNGRGAYVCHKPGCWDKVIAGDVLNRALRMTLTDDDRQCLQQAQP
jgi:predicted RNA-binding protein YlxR (DUF448 family)